MNLSCLRARVRSLRRKLALPYAELMLRRASYQFCVQWACAQADRRPTPSPQAFVRQVARTGFRLPTFPRAVQYLESCASLRRGPLPHLLLRALLPWAVHHPGVT